MPVTTISFIHSGDGNLVVTLSADEVLGEVSGTSQTSRATSGWEQVPYLKRQPLTDEGKVALGLPCEDVWEELFAHLVPLEPNELDDWATYLYEVRSHAIVGEPLAIVALSVNYEVVDCWPLPYDARAFTSQGATSDPRDDGKENL